MRAVNLIPSEQRQRGVSAPTGLPFLGLIGGLVVALIAAVLLIAAHNRVSSRESQLATIRASSARWSAAAATYESDITTAIRDQSTIESVVSIAGQRADWSKLLGQLAAVMPARSQLSSLSATASGPAAGSATVGSSPSSSSSDSAASTSSGTSGISITACAASQSVVADTMVAMRRITGVSAVTLGGDSRANAGSGSSASGQSGSAGCRYPVTFSLTLQFTPATEAGVAGTRSAASTDASNSGAAQ